MIYYVILISLLISVTEQGPTKAPPPKHATQKPVAHPASTKHPVTSKPVTNHVTTTTPSPHLTTTAKASTVSPQLTTATAKSPKAPKSTTTVSTLSTVRTTTTTEAPVSQNGSTASVSKSKKESTTVQPALQEPTTTPLAPSSTNSSNMAESKKSPASDRNLSENNETTTTASPSTTVSPIEHPKTETTPPEKQPDSSNDSGKSQPSHPGFEKTETSITFIEYSNASRSSSHTVKSESISEEQQSEVKYVKKQETHRETVSHPGSDLHDPNKGSASKQNGTAEQTTEVPKATQTSKKEDTQFSPEFAKFLRANNINASAPHQPEKMTPSENDSTKCPPTAPRLNLHMNQLLGEWYPVRASANTFKLWKQSFKQEYNDSNIGCLSMEYSLSDPKETDSDSVLITLQSAHESTKMTAIFVGDADHPKASKWAIEWPNGEQTLTSIAAAGVFGKEKGRYTWIIAVDCDLNEGVPPDWAVLSSTPKSLSDEHLKPILSIVEGLKYLRVQDAMKYNAEECHQ